MIITDVVLPRKENVYSGSQFSIPTAQGHRGEHGSWRAGMALDQEYRAYTLIHKEAEEELGKE